ncbi:MAG: GNAT family N-acetyltransferase [Acidobacteriaceae bacterium]|nr:GNAT family N-acetyltransferase [Acidobacteriaceae bacterium]
MAALSDAPLPEILELPNLGVADLDPLLDEEIKVWEQRFSWNFRPSAELLRRFLHMHSLSGYALRWNRQVIGYAYHVCEGRKGLIGDFYVRVEHARSSNETMLLGAVVQGLMLTPGIRRIESQLMLLQGRLQQAAPFSRYLTRHDRYFMDVDRESVLKLPARSTNIRATFLWWAERFQEETARLVVAAYKGHVDSEINDQYRSVPGARHFLTNIVRFPGCGQFAPGASIVAKDEHSGRICGVCLASLVSPKSGHVTQLCVLPGLRGGSLGYELLRRCLVRLTELGCESISLTVTCSNRDAIRLYEAAGFRTHASFPALVWEGF